MELGDMDLGDMDLGDINLGDSQVRRLSSDHLDARPARRWHRRGPVVVERIGRRGRARGVAPAGFLVWNPDRTAAAFGRSQLEESDVAVLDLSSGVVTPVPRSASAIAQPLLWTTDDVLLLTINNRGDTYGIAGSDGGTQPPQILSARWPQPLGTGPVSANPRCRAAG